MFCIQVPMRETHCPVQNSLKFLWWRAGKARRSLEWRSWIGMNNCIQPPGVGPGQTHVQIIK